MSSKFINRRQARWFEFFSKFNFKIISKPGSLYNKANVFTRQSGDVFLKKKRRQFQWQTLLKKDNSDNQQLTLEPIINDDSDNSETVSNLDFIDYNFFSQFFVIINDAIWAAFQKIKINKNI